MRVMKPNRLFAYTVFVAALVLALTGCGGPSAAEKEAAADKKAAAAAVVAQKKAEAEQEAAAAAEAARKQVAHDDCSAALQGLTDSLDQVNSRLAVGINNAGYGERLGDVRVEYDKLDIDAITAIDSECLDAAAKLENAFNLFVQVHTLWNDCIADYGCDFSEGQTNATAQNKWTRAGTAIENSKNQLAAMAPAE